VSSLPRELADGLVLRTARAGDREAIVALEVAAFGESDEPIVRSRLGGLDSAGRAEDPVDHPARWLVVEDPSGGGRLVSASVLLSHRLRLGEVTVPVGQIENVATDPACRRRRLVRSQFDAHHRASAERGDLAILITGIPYLYRRLGYGYGLDYPTIHLPTTDNLGDPGPDHVRPAQDSDLAGILRLDLGRPTEHLRIVRDESAWRRTLDRSVATRFEQLVVAQREGQIVGFAQLEARPGAERLYVQPAMAADDQAARALLHHAVTQGAAHGELVVAFDNPGTTYGQVLGGVGGPVHHSHGIYVRVPDAVALVDALRPVLSERLTASRFADRRGVLSVSLYESGVSISYDQGVVTDVAPTDAVEDPFESEGVGIPPDLVGALVFGRFGAEALQHRVDDVTLGRHAGLMEVLFPRLQAELLADL